MKKLRDLRERKDLKQIDVARALNIAKNTYSNYENGNRSPDYETLLRIANFFDVSIDYLLETDNDNKKFIIQLTNEQYNKFHDIFEIIQSQVKKQEIKISDSNIIKGNNNSINIKNSYNKKERKK